MHAKELPHHVFRNAVPGTQTGHLMQTLRFAEQNRQSDILKPGLRNVRARNQVLPRLLHVLRKHQKEANGRIPLLSTEKRAPAAYGHNALPKIIRLCAKPSYNL